MELALMDAVEIDQPRQPNCIHRVVGYLRALACMTATVSASSLTRSELHL